MTRILQTGAATRQAGVQLTTVIPVRIRRHGGRKRVVPAPTDAHAIAEHDPPMLTALTRAFHWQRLIEEGVMKSGSEIARREGLHPTTVNELLRLTLLSPAMVQAILAGRQPKALSLLWLKNHQLPAAWDAQQALFDALDASGGFDSLSHGTVAGEPCCANPHRAEGASKVQPQVGWRKERISAAEKPQNAPVAAVRNIACAGNPRQDWPSARR